MEIVGDWAARLAEGWGNSRLIASMVFESWEIGARNSLVRKEVLMALS
jgi:hypothetical protein